MSRPAHPWYWTDRKKWAADIGGTVVVCQLDLTAQDQVQAWRWYVKTRQAIEPEWVPDPPSPAKRVKWGPSRGPKRGPTRCQGVRLTIGILKVLDRAVKINRTTRVRMVEYALRNLMNNGDWTPVGTNAPTKYVQFHLSENAVEWLRFTAHELGVMPRDIIEAAIQRFANNPKRP